MLGSLDGAEFVDDIIVVDDASRDDTAEVAGKPAIRLLVLQTERNCGVGGTIELGYRKGPERGAQVW